MKAFMHTMRFTALLFVLIGTCQPSFAVIKISTKAPKTEQISDFTPTQISTLNKAQLEQQLGRKLTFKEKISVAIVKRQVKKNKSARINAPVRKDGYASAGFACSLISLLIFGIPLGIAGIILSGIGLSRISKSEGKLEGRGLATAGVIIGLISIVAVLVIVGAMM